MNTLQCYEHREALWWVYLLGTVVAARGGVLLRIRIALFSRVPALVEMHSFSISVSERRMIGSSTEIQVQQSDANLHHPSRLR
jgi:hypothetical protein